MSGQGPDEGPGLKAVSEAGTEESAAASADVREAAASIGSEDSHPDVRQRVAGGPSRAASEAGDECFTDALEAVPPDPGTGAHAPGAGSLRGCPCSKSRKACPSGQCIDTPSNMQHILSSSFAFKPLCLAWNHCLPGAPSVLGCERCTVE